MEIDQRKFKQIVLNLLSNAVKFTPDGGDIIVGLRRINYNQMASMLPLEQEISDIAEAEYFLELCVIDTGIGMAASELDRLFQPFVQMDGGLSRKYEGSGLGLAIVKQLVELHRGMIEVKSKVGEGSQFTVFLPYGESTSALRDTER
jgi:signal transduction histidine kinase